MTTTFTSFIDMIHEEDQTDTWHPEYNSPFSTVTYDLCHFYFFNYWCKKGKFSTAKGLHDRLHDTDWYEAKHSDNCPGVEGIALWCKKWQMEIS